MRIREFRICLLSLIPVLVILCLLEHVEGRKYVIIIIVHKTNVARQRMVYYYKVEVETVI